MHDALLPIGIRTTVTDPKMSRHFTHCWTCRSVCRDTNSLDVRTSNLFAFNLYENSLHNFTLRKRTCQVVTFIHHVGCSRPPSSVDNVSATNQKILKVDTFAIMREKTANKNLPVLPRRFCDLFVSKILVKTVLICECFSEVSSKFHRCIFTRCVHRNEEFFIFFL